MATITRAVAPATLVLLLGSGALAASPADKCEASKVKISTAYSSCLLKAQLKAVKNPAAEISGDLTKCDTTFTDKWAKAETKGRGACPTSGDAGSTQSLLTNFTGFFVKRFKPVAFTDNGDGTITDNRTGLMWEKKDGADGVQNHGDPHDVDNTYTWSASGVAPDGTAFTDFLAQLNNCSTNINFALLGGFAGHCDWRLPNILELIGIEDNAQGVCGGGSGPCINPIFGPTTANGYWSGTTYAGDATEAWFWYFGGGSGTNYAPKVNDPAWFRAVRGGM